MEQINEEIRQHMVPVVLAKGGAIFANSRDVAAYFEKQHAHVLRDIDNLVREEPTLALSNFGEGAYTLPETGSQQHRCYDMDRKGFVLLCMGFTGKKALKFKMAYIDAFDAMERELREARPAALPQPDFDILDTSRIRAYSAWISTVSRIYGPAKARALYEQLPWPQVHTREEGALYDLACDDAQGCLAHLLRVSAHRGQSVRAMLTLAWSDEIARKALAGLGVRAVVGGKREEVAIAIAHPFLDEAFEGTPWAGDWRIPLLSLDGAKASRAKISFGAASSHAVILPRGVVSGFH